VLHVAGHALSWPVSLSGGQALVYWPGAPTRLRGQGIKPAEVPSPAAVTLPAGRHIFRFTCTDPLVATASVRLMLLPPEQLPLTEQR
jgi:hypothetical protein